jgi:hypothetical protein
MQSVRVQGIEIITKSCNGHGTCEEIGGLLSDIDLAPSVCHFHQSWAPDRQGRAVLVGDPKGMRDRRTLVQREGHLGLGLGLEE